MESILKFLKKKLKEITQDNKGFIRQGKPTIEPLREALVSFAQKHPSTAQKVISLEPKIEETKFKIGYPIGKFFAEHPKLGAFAEGVSVPFKRFARLLGMKFVEPEKRYLARKPETTGEKLTEIGGRLVGETPFFLLAEQATAPLAGAMGLANLGRYQKPARLSLGALREALTGLAYGATQAKSLSDIPRSARESALAFAPFGAAARVKPLAGKVAALVGGTTALELLQKKKPSEAVSAGLGAGLMAPLMMVGSVKEVKKPIGKFLGDIPDELKPIAMEAMKYKRTEDFIKAIKKGIFLDKNNLPPILQGAKKDVELAKKIGDIEEMKRALGVLSERILEINAKLKTMSPFRYFMNSRGEVGVEAVEVSDIPRGIYEPKILGKRISEIKKKEIPQMIEKIKEQIRKKLTDEIIGKEKINLLKELQSGKSSVREFFEKVQSSSPVAFRIGSRYFFDAGIPEATSSIERLVSSQYQPSVSKTKTLLSSILKSDPRFQKYFGSLEEDLATMLSTLYQKSLENVKPFIEIIKNTTGKTKISVGLKPVESAIIKLLRKRLVGKWTRPEEANDILRGTILVENEKEALQMLKKLKKYMVKYDNYFKKPKGGYTGLNVDLQMPNGLKAELQIHTKESLERAQKMHTTYKRQQLESLKKQIEKEIFQERRLKIPLTSKKERRFFRTALKSAATPEEVKPILEQSPERFYTPKSNSTLLAEASRMIEEKGFDKIYKDWQEDKVSKEHIVAIGEILAQKAFKEGRMEEGFKILEELGKKGTSLGRAVQSFSIWSRLTPEGMLAYANKTLEKAKEKYKASLTGKIFKKLDKDFELTQQEKEAIWDAMQKANTARTQEEKEKYTKIALEIIARKVPVGISDFLDVFRYNNMLSGPLTHLRNFYSNFFNTFINLPLTMLLEGKPKEAFVYSKTAIKEIPKGLDYFFQALKEAVPADLSKAEVIISEAKYQKIPRPFRIFTDLMIASDRMNRHIIESALIATGKSKEEASKIAKEVLYLTELSEKKRGVLTDAIASIGDGLEAFGRRFRPIRWFVPFIKTPFNVAAFLLEHSPVGILNIMGNQNKRVALARSILGSIAFAVGADLAAKGRITWAPPTDPEEKKYFYASGRKPFSVYINGVWVPAWYLGPYAFALLMPAALQYYYKEAPDALSDEDWKKLAKAIGSIAYFWSQSTPMSGLGGFVRTVQGDIDFSVLRNLGYTSQQIIPFNSMLRWINNFFDNVYRKPKGFLEQFLSSIPVISSRVIKDYYKEPTGEPARRELINQFLPWAVGVPKEGWKLYEEMFKERQKERQLIRFKNVLKKKLEEGEELSPEEVKVALASEIEKQPETPLEVLVNKAKVRQAYDDIKGVFDVYVRTADEEVKRKIKQNVEAAGLDFEEAFYTYLTGFDLKTRIEYAKSIASQMEDRNQMLEVLVLLRRRSEINGQRLLTDTVIRELYKDGVITAQEKSFLTSIDDLKKTAKGYKIKAKKGKGRGKKIKIKTGTTPTFKIPAIRLPTPPKISLPKTQAGVVRLSFTKPKAGFKYKTPKQSLDLLRVAEYRPRKIKFRIRRAKVRL